MPPILLGATGPMIAQQPIRAPPGRTFYMLALEEDTRLAHHIEKFVNNRHLKIKVIIKGNNLPRDPATGAISFQAASVAWDATDEELPLITAICNNWYENFVPAAMLDPNNLPAHDGPILFIYFVKLADARPAGYKFGMVPYSRVTVEGAKYARFLADTITNVMALIQNRQGYRQVALQGCNEDTEAEVADIVQTSLIRVFTRDFIYN